MNDREQPPSESVSLETVFSLGHNSRRRTLIRVLAVHDRELTLNDLTKEVVARETDGDITDKSGETVTRVASSLYHKHIPRLVDAGVVKYNDKRLLVEPTEKLETVVSHLESISTGQA